MSLMRTGLLFCLCGIIFSVGGCKNDATGPTNDQIDHNPDKSMFEPPDDSCLFILGQADENEMMDYIFQVKSDPVPAGFAFYTSLSNGAVQTDMPRYKNFMENYLNTVLQLAIWIGER